VFELRLKDPASGGPKLGEFKPGENYTLHFDYYLAGVRGRLRVCTGPNPIQRGSEHCPFEMDGADMTKDSREWRTGVVSLPSGTGVGQIRFVADRLPRNYIIGLDAIRLMDRYGRLPAKDCSSSRTATASERLLGAGGVEKIGLAADREAAGGSFRQ